jgi:hypothetical protein
MMSTASVRDVCADILDGLSSRTPYGSPANLRQHWGAETLRWVECFERGESVEAMRDEIEDLRDQIADLRDDAIDASAETQRADKAEAELALLKAKI